MASSGRTILLVAASAAVVVGAVFGILMLRRPPRGKPEIFTGVGHAGRVYSLSFNPDGTLLASGGADATFKIWDPNSGILLRTIAGHDHSVTVAGWSADGKVVATGRKDTITLWNAASGELVRNAAVDARRIQEAAWSPDGKLLAGIVDLEGDGELGVVRVWRADTGAVITTFGEHFDRLQGLAWSADSKRLAASGGVLFVWNAEANTFQRLRSTEGNFPYGTVAFSPDGTTLAETGPGLPYLQLWRMGNGSVAWEIKDPERNRSIAWSPDGKMIAVGTPKQIKLRSAVTGEVVRTFEGPPEPVQAIAWANDGKTIATGGANGVVKLWDVQAGTTKKALSVPSNPVLAVSWSPDGQTIATGSADGSVRLWQASAGNLIRAMNGHTGGVVSLSWRADSKALASGSKDRTAKLWNVQMGTELRTLAGPKSGVGSESSYGAPSGVLVAWSPTGRALAGTGFSDNNARVWDPDSGEQLGMFEAPNPDLFSLSWNSDGSRLAAGRGYIEIWDMKSRSLAISSVSDHFSADYVAFRPDGKTLVNATRERFAAYHHEAGMLELLRVSDAPDAGLTVKQHDTDPAQQGGPHLLTREHTMHYPSYPEAAVWSPDGRLVATPHDDGTIQLWDGNAGAFVRALTGHAGFAMSVAWSPDSRKLASGGLDGTLRVWDAATGEVESITTLLPNNEWITVLPKSLLYSSSAHGDEFASVRFGAEKEMVPLVTDRYRKLLHVADARTHLTDPPPQLQQDWLQTVRATFAGLLPAPAARPVVAKEAAPADKKAPPSDAHKPRANPRDGLVYVWIAPGTFQMGCSPGDTECRPNEQPPHMVTLTKEFWMGQTPVTVAAYKRYASAASQPPPPSEDNSGGHLNAAEDHPVSGIGWVAAKQFCEWAWMRLPTEAEWEYAARAGSKEARYGGLDEIAWYADNSGRLHVDSSAIPSGFYQLQLANNDSSTKPVGEKKPNGFGLFDMLGNVWEWTSDEYDAEYYAKSEAIDPKGPPDDGTRTDGFHVATESVLRGGSWYSQPNRVRVSMRHHSRTGLVDSGFRCVGGFQ